MKIGDRVTYVDPIGRERNALVNSVWDGGDPANPRPSLNLVAVSDDPNRFDSYSRQTEHVTSVVHASMQPAGANCWK